MSLLPQHHANEVQSAQSSEEGTRLRGQDLNDIPDIIFPSIFLRKLVQRITLDRYYRVEKKELEDENSKFDRDNFRGKNTVYRSEESFL